MPRGDLADLRLEWRGDLDDDELYELTRSHGGRPSRGWWDRIRPHSLGWVTARTAEGALVGFVNVAWDGGDHAILVDTKTHPDWRHRRQATAVVAMAVDRAAAAGCEVVHVDFEPAALAGLYVDACGFTPTNAALLRLS